MLTREHIERMLAVNGLPKDAPDEEIKSILLSAHWHQNDVETALLVLRENKKTHSESVGTLHNVFSSDTRLSAEAVNSLLGIKIDIPSRDLKKGSGRTHGRTLGFYLRVLVLGLLVAALAISWIMWQLQLGFWHDPTV